MAQWFETKVRYHKTQDDGAVKAVTEAYMVDALSFTEAEARITEEMMPHISGEFQVSAVRKVNIADMFVNEGDKNLWYKVKYNIITIDEKTAVEKRTAQFAMVEADDFAGALDNFMAGMKQVMFDFEVAQITETAIMDVLGANLGGDKQE